MTKEKRALIEGRAAVIVIDIQAGAFIDLEEEARYIPHMPGYPDRMLKARDVIDAARARAVPVIFIQEVHRPNLVDFGRELDGAEDVHCVEGRPNTEIARQQTGFRDDDYLIKKRRYSAFYGTDLEILLKGLKIDTLILVGGLTDVCVHYTFADAHQGDYFTRVVSDCVAGSAIEAHDASLRAMEYLQTGAVQDSVDVIAAINAASQS